MPVIVILLDLLKRTHLKAFYSELTLRIDPCPPLLTPSSSNTAATL